MKKALLMTGVVIIVVALVCVKYFTLLLDDKELAIIVTKTYQMEEDYADKRKLSEAVNNIFIGEVIEQVGNEEYSGKPYTLYSVRITQNIKGGFLDDIVVAKEGGYYKENGKLYRLTYKKEPVLTAGKMYLFTTNPNKEKEWQVVIPQYGSTEISNEEQKFRLIDEFKQVITK